MSEQTERERLIDELSKTIMVEIALSGEVDVDKIADFILADRKRIVTPLVKAIEESKAEYEEKSWVILSDAIDETLKLAGVDL